MWKAVCEPITALSSVEALSRRYGRPYRTCVGLQANCWLSMRGHQNRMNGYHTAIQLLLRVLVRLCWLTQIQLQTRWLPGRFTMKSKSVMSDEGSVVESQGWWMAGKCWQAPYMLVLWWAQGGLWTKTEHDNADHNQGKKCSDHRLPRHKGPTLSVFV